MDDDFEPTPDPNAWNPGRVAGGAVGVSDYQIRLDALKLAMGFEDSTDDDIVEIAQTFEAYLRGETKTEETAMEGTGG